MIVPRGLATPTALTGGTEGCLDAIAVATLNHDTIAMTCTEAGAIYFHIFNAYGTAATNSPSVIRPIDYAGYGNWEMLSSPFSAQTPNVATVGPYDQIFGGNAIKTAAHVVTVDAFSCMDSTNTVQIYKSTSTAVTIPTVANAVYILAAVILTDGTHTISPYATIAAVAADVGVNITAFRLLDYWPTNGSSNACDGMIRNGVKWFDRFADNTINSTTDPPAGITTAIDISTKLPVSMVDSVLFGAQAVTNNLFIGVSSVSGTVMATGGGDANASSGTMLEWGSHFAGFKTFVPLNGNNIYWGEAGYTNNAGTAQLAIHAVKLKR